MSGAVATRTSMETIEAERREFWLELHIADRASRRFHDFLQLAAGKGDFRERELCCNAATTPATPPMLCVGQTASKSVVLRRSVLGNRSVQCKKGLVTKLQLLI